MSVIVLDFYLLTADREDQTMSLLTRVHIVMDVFIQHTCDIDDSRRQWRQLNIVCSTCCSLLFTLQTDNSLFPHHNNTVFHFLKTDLYYLCIFKLLFHSRLKDGDFLL